MLYISFEDFYGKAGKMPRLSREQEKECALAMTQGDLGARQRLICSYLPQVADHLARAPQNIRTLNTVYSAIATLEQGVDSFNFQQDSERFSHHLSWRLRQCTTGCIAEQF